MIVRPILNLEWIRDNWDGIGSLLQAATDDRCTLEDIYSNLWTGEYTLWCARSDVDEVYAITSFIHYPTATDLRVIFTAGSSPSWPPLIEQLEEFARANDCDAVEVMGRKGWAKVLPTYEFSHITIRKKL